MFANQTLTFILFVFDAGQLFAVGLSAIQELPAAANVG